MVGLPTRALTSPSVGAKKLPTKEGADNSSSNWSRLFFKGIVEIPLPTILSLCVTQFSVGHISLCVDDLFFFFAFFNNEVTASIIQLTEEFEFPAKTVFANTV